MVASRKKKSDESSTELKNKDILLVVDAVSNEKNIDKNLVFQAIERALAVAAESTHKDEEVSVQVEINHATGAYKTFRVWEVVADEEVEVESKQISLTKAKSIDDGLGLEDFVKQEIESPSFGRIAAQQAKQVIMQSVRAAERLKVADEYSQRIGEILFGVVKKVSREGVVLDVEGTAEAIIGRDDLIPKEMFRVNDRVRGYLYAISDEPRGPQLLLSRTHSEFLKMLFSIEVPEINEGVIIVKASARDPGARAKIAVKSNDRRIDPIGACVGMRGARVQAVSNELNNERVDIIVWDDNPAQLVINAMSPAEVESIVVDEEAHSMDVAVTEEQLPQAIGRGGQNIRLASLLTGWTLNVMSEGAIEEKVKSDSEELLGKFMTHLDIDEDLAALLIQEGFSSVEDLINVPAAEMLKISGFDTNMVEELKQRAQDALLQIELEVASESGGAEPAEDLLNLDGMTRTLALTLATDGIVTREDLAEQATDDLVELTGMNEKSAGELIMKARAHWFEEE